MRRPLVLFQMCALCAASSFWACGASTGPAGVRPAPLATEWLDRAKKSYRAADFDDARDAAAHAIAVAPNDVEARELAARVALVRLDYPEVLRFTEGLASTDAHGMRGRAYWFAGDIEHAADELETLLTDPAATGTDRRFLLRGRAPLDRLTSNPARLADRGSGTGGSVPSDASVACVRHSIQHYTNPTKRYA